MNKKSLLDTAIIFSCAAAAILNYQYVENAVIRNILMAVLIVIELVFLAFFLKDRRKYGDFGVTQDKNITEIVLLNEENEEIATWDIFGKVSIVIGKQGRHNHVDVDLKSTPYAGAVDLEHAVMNYFSGSWYIEDLDSENGIKIEKMRDGGTYRVSSKEPCKIEKFDKMYLGMTKLCVR